MRINLRRKAKDILEGVTAQFSILSLGGTGCKIGGEISPNWLNIGMLLGYDTDEKYLSLLKNKYDKRPGGAIRSLKSTRSFYDIGTPAERNLLIGEIKMKYSEDIETAARFLSPSTGGEHFVFTIFSTGGGTGHGFFRTISKRSENLDRIIPIVVFPRTFYAPKDEKEVLLNSYILLGRIINTLDKYRLVVFLDNDKFRNIGLDETNKNIADYIGTITEAVASKELGETNINIGGALTTLQTSGKIATFGFGTSFFRSDGIESTREAMGMAYENRLCHTIDEGKKNGIVFAITPYKADVRNTKLAIQDFSENRGIEVGGRIFIRRTDTYTIDIVLLISGKFYHPNFLNIPIEDLPNYEDWFDILSLQLRNMGVSEDEITELRGSAYEDFKKGFGTKI